jgi:hypothetical protein
MQVLHLLLLNSTTLQRENGVRVQYVEHRENSFFGYHLTAKLCDVKPELVCNMWRINAPFASVIT